MAGKCRGRVRARFRAVTQPKAKQNEQEAGLTLAEIAPKRVKKKKEEQNSELQIR
ncbi:hypothetical protein [Roseateles sp.]|jgi:hypothetical protein|uniref:hypothetical protein n=1 Tax=Roseateles sp. TaxID=1971397 RepID=UPI00391BFB83